MSRSVKSNMVLSLALLGSLATAAPALAADLVFRDEGTSSISFVQPSAPQSAAIHGAAAGGLVFRDEGTSSVSFAAPQALAQLAAHHPAVSDHLIFRDENTSAVSFH